MLCLTCLFKDYLDSDQNEQYNNEILVLECLAWVILAAAVKLHFIIIGHNHVHNCCFGLFIYEYIDLTILLITDTLS